MASEAFINLHNHGAELSTMMLKASESNQQLLNSVWLTTATFLVLFMQIGFLALESGWVRSKNSISVAQRNMADFCVCFLVFFLFGFMIAYGPSIAGIFGWNLSGKNLFIDTHIDYFLFQAVFAGAAVTIASGTLAERMTFKSYLFLAVFTAGLIYPVIVHWVWGKNIIENNTAWLHNLGYRDYAGSTIVHAVGGWVALSAAILLGPRAGKFDADGNPVKMPCHSMVLSGVGALILLISWIGFNAGNSQPGSPEFKHIILNTMLSASTGLISALVFAYFRDNSFQPQRSTNGLLGGLVAISASCNVVGSHAAIMIGLISGVVVCLSEDFIEKKLKIDDVVGAISVHGVCGSLGAILFAVFTPAELLPTGSRLSQLAIQALGVSVIFIFCLSVSYILVRTLNSFVPIRSTPENEERGSNLAEHAITLETEVFLENERKVNEEQRQFIRMASHEFRTPLSIIDTLSHNLKRRWHKYSQEDASAKIANIQKSVKRLTNLIDTILNAGKMEHGGIKYSPEPTSIAQTMRDKEKQLMLLSEQHDIEILIDCAEDTLVMIDRNLFDNILDNLVSNAIKYSPQASKIEISLVEASADITIIIKDFGLGIPEDELPNLFKKYFRATNASGIGGTGIGLTVVKNFVDLHSGSVHVESTVNEGTSFIITFPVYLSQQQTDLPSEEQRTAS